MVCRRRISGFDPRALKKLFFKTWKSYAEDQKILKLRADQGLKGFINFLSGLNNAEREVVIPLVLEVKDRVMDCRQRRKEIRMEKAFTFRKFCKMNPPL